MENGEDEEDEALEDSVSDPNVPVRLRPKPAVKRPEGRAPTMTIEAVRVGRPLKVLALIFSIIGLIVLLVSMTSTYWIHIGSSIHIGLFQQCSTTPQSECTLTLTQSMERIITWSLALFSFLCILIGLALFIGGILTLVVKRKIICYRFVIGFYTIGFLSTSAAILYTTVVFFYLKPTSIYTDKVMLDNDTCFGWALMTASCSAVITFVSIQLLVIDRNAEEIAYCETIRRSSTYLQIED